MRLSSRVFFLGFLATFILLPTTTLAADQRCFTKTQCEQARDDLGGGTGGGFYDKSDAKTFCGVNNNGGNNAAGEPIGFCLPAGQSVTNIGFGGKKNFGNFGEFIQYAYRYGMWLAGILAVAQIVVAGFMWAASGGNSDMIGSAKNKIIGSVSGLIILALAYTVLYSINPYLVQLRLPQTWMINTIGLAPPFCNAVKGKSLAYAGTSESDDVQKEQAFTQAQSTGYKIPSTPEALPVGENQEASVPLCGHSYLVDGAATQTCLGGLCTPAEDGVSRSCLPFDLPDSGGSYTEKNIIKKSACWRGSLIIRYSVSGLFEGLINQATNNLAGMVEEGDDDNWLEDQNLDSDLNDIISIAVVCKDDKIGKTFISSEKIEVETTITRIINTQGYDQFVIQYSNLDKKLNEYIANKGSNCKFFGPAGSGDKVEVVGIFVKNMINVNYDTDDKLIHIGVGPTSKNKGEAFVYTTPPGRITGVSPAWVDKYIPIAYVTNPNEGFFMDFSLTKTHVAETKIKK